MQTCYNPHFRNGSGDIDVRGQKKPQHVVGWGRTIGFFLYA